MTLEFLLYIFVFCPALSTNVFYCKKNIHKSLFSFAFLHFVSLLN